MAARFIKMNVCGICLGELSIIQGMRLSQDTVQADQGGLRVHCWPCGTNSTATNTVRRHKAAQVLSDRAFAAREIRAKKPLTQEGMEQTLKDLGF
jgi:hypothetical protein